MYIEYSLFHRPFLIVKTIITNEKLNVNVIVSEMNETV